jgi:glutathione S-transferase kappa 1
MRLCRPRSNIHSSTTIIINHNNNQTIRVHAAHITNQLKQHALISHPTAAAAAAATASTEDGTSGNTPSLIPVKFYYDILSPYSYFAYHTLLRYREEWGLNIQLKPVFQSALISATKNQPPALVPAKQPYLQKDVIRLAQYFELPLPQFPPSHMSEVLMGTLPIQRMLIALQQLHGDNALEKVTSLLWHRYLVLDVDILSIESRLQVLMEGAGLSNEQAQSVLTASTQDAAKKGLASNTQEALAAGAFGVPAFIVPTYVAGAADEIGSSALVFGSDRFHILAQLLGKKWLGPIPNKQNDTAGNKKRKLISRL